MAFRVAGSAGSRQVPVLLIHSWWGRTGSFLGYAEALASEGFFVGVSDLFDGKTADTEAEARQLRAAPRKQPMYRTLIADIETLRARSGSRQVAVVGFSMGGHWAVWLAQRAELQVSHAVLYYAARGGDFSASKASFLAHFAENDPWVSAAARRGMERAIAKTTCAYQPHDYPGTGHWFAESGRAGDYDSSAAALAFERTLAHLAA